MSRRQLPPGDHIISKCIGLWTLGNGQIQILPATYHRMDSEWVSPGVMTNVLRIPRNKISRHLRNKVW